MPDVGREKTKSCRSASTESWTWTWHTSGSVNGIAASSEFGKELFQFPKVLLIHWSFKIMVDHQAATTEAYSLATCTWMHPQSWTTVIHHRVHWKAMNGTEASKKYQKLKLSSRLYLWRNCGKMLRQSTKWNGMGKKPTCSVLVIPDLTKSVSSRKDSPRGANCWGTTCERCQKILYRENNRHIYSKWVQSLVLLPHTFEENCAVDESPSPPIRWHPALKTRNPVNYLKERPHPAMRSSLFCASNNSRSLIATAHRSLLCSMMFRTWDNPCLVRILDSEHESTTSAFAHKIVIQRRPKSAEVQKTSGTRSKAESGFGRNFME